MTKQFMGYEGYGYHKFFMDDPKRAAELLEKNHDRMEMLMFARDSTELFKEHFARLGGLEKWLVGSEQADKIEDMTRELSEIRRDTFTSPEDYDSQLGGFGPGYGGPIMWYIGLNGNINVEDEKNERSDWETYKTDKDVLVVLSDKDPIALTNIQTSMAEVYVQSTEHQLKVESLACGHFVTLEKSQELSKILEQFFEGR